MIKVSPAAARRYARALLDVASESADPAAVRDELRSARTLLEAYPQLTEVLANPALGADSKKRLVQAVFGGRASRLLLRLLELLVERRRVALLPAIEQAYGTLWNARRGVAAAEAVSVVPLSAAERRALIAALEQATGLGIELETREDPSLLGGLLVRVGGRSYDGTLRTRLRALRERLTGGAPA